jgi:hypothetical protein
MRLRRGLLPLTYTTIGQLNNLSKSTVSAIFNNRYHATTQGRLYCQIARTIYEEGSGNQLSTGIPADESSAFNPSDPPDPSDQPTRASARKRASAPTRARARAQTRRPRTAIVNAYGFFSLGHRHYFASRFFAGSCIVSKLRDQSVRISQGRYTRICNPIDPTTNQLGYDCPHREIA